MKKSLLITLCCVFFLCDQVLAEGENEIKRGTFPYMAFLYYPDDSVIEPSGSRFLRAAVLVKPDWLITSSVGPITVNEVPLGFPRKTLLARLGAIAIDYKFTLSEDEEEQEREVIQIVRPSNQSSTQWWRTDITLLKTLMPFNLTSTVNVGTIGLLDKAIINFTDCFILIYAKSNGHPNEDAQLMQFFVDVVAPGTQECGAHYYADTMLCAVDNIEYRAPVNNTEFCHGNSGGPLVCDQHITGIQTYIENKCMQPHLYQHLSAWESFITCGIEDKCNEEQCSNVCTVLNKDDEATMMKDQKDEDPQITTEPNTSTLTEEISVPTGTEEVMGFDDVYVTATTASTTTSTERIVEEVTTTTSETTTTTPSTTTEPVTEHSEEISVTEHSEETSSSWPKEKYPQEENTVELESSKSIERKANVEAQRQDVKKVSSAAGRMCLLKSLLSICILACLI